MRFYEKMINECKDKIIKSEKNIVITGNNMSGKTKLLEKILDSCQKNTYFIGANNRTFNIHDMPEDILANEMQINNIYENRIKKLKNSINEDCFGRGISKFSDKIAYTLFKIFFLKDEKFRENIDIFLKGYNITFTSNGDRIGIFIDEVEVSYSTGLKAMIRLFVEIWNAEKNGIKTIVIDEIDMHIDQKKSVFLFDNIFEIFPNVRFIVTLHNMTGIAGLKRSDIFVLKGKEYRIYNSNEFLDFRTIARDIFGIKKITESEKNNDEITLEKLENALYEKGELTEDERKNYMELNKKYEIFDDRYQDILKIIGEIIE